MNTPRPRETAARLVIAASLVVLGAGTLAGSSPTWPDPLVYGIAAWITAALWLGTVIENSRRANEIADAALLALALMRGAGYTLDLVRTAQEGLLAAIAAWAIVVGLAARPVRHHCP